jgi:hypothetical protein
MPAGQFGVQGLARLHARTPCHQVEDDHVRRSGDADGALLRDEREDLLGRGVRLPGAGRSLQRQVRIAEHRGQPDCGPSDRLIPGNQGIPSPGRSPQQRSVAASSPSAPSRTIRSPRSRSRSRSCVVPIGPPRSGRRAAARRRPGQPLARSFRRIVHRPYRPASLGHRINGCLPPRPRTCVPAVGTRSAAPPIS